jgi:hypothetical protein
MTWSAVANQAQGLGGLEVVDQIKFCDLLHW